MPRSTWQKIGPQILPKSHRKDLPRLNLWPHNRETNPKLQNGVYKLTEKKNFDEKNSEILPDEEWTGPKKEHSGGTKGKCHEQFETQKLDQECDRRCQLRSSYWSFADSFQLSQRKSCSQEIQED